MHYSQLHLTHNEAKIYFALHTVSHLATKCSWIKSQPLILNITGCTVASLTLCIPSHTAFPILSYWNPFTSILVQKSTSQSMMHNCISYTYTLHFTNILVPKNPTLTAFGTIASLAKLDLAWWAQLFTYFALKPIKCKIAPYNVWTHLLTSHAWHIVLHGYM